jgi:hypothetical protein
MHDRQLGLAPYDITGHNALLAWGRQDSRDAWTNLAEQPTLDPEGRDKA